MLRRWCFSPLCGIHYNSLFQQQLFFSVEVIHTVEEKFSRILHCEFLVQEVPQVIISWELLSQYPHKHLQSPSINNHRFLRKLPSMSLFWCYFRILKICPLVERSLFSSLVVLLTLQFCFIVVFNSFAEVKLTENNYKL